MPTTTKNILITGVNRGLGHGLALACLNRGDHVLGLGRNSAADLESHPGFQFARADIADTGECNAALETLLNNRNRLDCVILNAGVLGPIADMRDQPVETMKEVMEVNLWANKNLLDTLLGKDISVAQVVAISSGASVNGNRGWGGYSISKAALNMLVKLYANERKDIHFSALAPGLIDTSMQQQIRKLPDDTPFPSVAKLKQASGTAAMPDPTTAGQLVLRAIDRLPDLVESGTFADIRKPPLNG
jgi:benzil reductase ((S)-benzoin forming)